MMDSFGTPRLVRVKRNRDDGVATRIRSDTDGETLHAHGLIVARRSQPGTGHPQASTWSNQWQVASFPRLCFGRQSLLAAPYGS